MPTLSVELNGDGVHSIRAPDRFTTSRPFAIELENLGRSTHVHLHLDDELDRVASIDAVNHFVEDDSVRRVHVSTTDVPEPVRGKLKLVTGYGSSVEYVDIRIEPREESGEEAVVVDETLSKPPAEPPEPSLGDRIGIAIDRIVGSGGFPAFVVALLAALVAVAIALAVDSAIVTVAVAVVLAVTLAAILLAAW